MHYYLKKVLLFWLLGCSLALYGQNQPPITVLSADVVIGVAPLVVNFSSLGTNDPEGAILAYGMNFGDGTTKQGMNPPLNFPPKTYKIPGIYTASLNITDSFGAYTQASVTIIVQAPLGTYDLPVKATADAHLEYITPTNVVIHNNATIQVDNMTTLYEGFVKFDPSNANAGNCGTPTGGLKLELTDDSIFSNTTDVEVSLSSTNMWSEGNINLLTDMGTTFTPISSATVPPGGTATWNLPGVNPSSEFTLKLATLTPNSIMEFASSENIDPALRPCLLVEMDNTAGLCQFQVKVKPRIALYGPFNATGNALMDDDLRVQGLIPVIDPYGFGVVRGIDTADDFGDQSIVDWVVVQLRDKNDPTILITEVPALVRKDGYVVSPQNVNSDLFISANDDDYYVAIKHHNHLGMMTATPIALSNTSVIIDFADPSAADYIPTYTVTGDPAQKFHAGYYMMFAGNVNGEYSGYINPVCPMCPPDTQVRATGPPFMNDFSTLINNLGRFSVIIYNTYEVSDVNLDGTVRATGPPFMNDAPTIINSLGHFSYVFSEQIP